MVGGMAMRQPDPAEARAEAPDDLEQVSNDSDDGASAVADDESAIMARQQEHPLKDEWL